MWVPAETNSPDSWHLDPECVDGEVRGWREIDSRRACHPCTRCVRESFAQRVRNGGIQT